MFEEEKKNGNAVLRIKGSMSVFDIASIHKELLSYFDNYNDLTINLKGVDFCDISALQLLYSARKTAESMGKIFLVDGESDSVMDTFSKAGLNPEAMFTKKQKIETDKKPEGDSNGQDHHDGR